MPITRQTSIVACGNDWQQLFLIKGDSFYMNGWQTNHAFPLAPLSAILPLLEVAIHP
jgi:hypothetical protein